MIGSKFIDFFTDIGAWGRLVTRFCGIPAHVAAEERKKAVLLELFPVGQLNILASLLATMAQLCSKSVTWPTFAWLTGVLPAAGAAS
ncbi:hypothetical protein D3C76_1303010 [compost metagenome]